ncbi:MAG: tryptophan--tRNA ligase [Candidatus Berkelbacteria bacterium]|nr:tryptophan--tRNA ligase [Candidatus Berkelbacteria bacterium]
METSLKPIVVSGIRATGNVHLGNYLGAIRNFVQMQDEYNCHFFVADWHSLTTLTNPAELRDNLGELVLDYLAAGLDPEKAVIFAQSSVPQIPELSWILSNLMMVSVLERCPTYKEKAASQPDNINTGLLTYPILMAADILIQKANVVPVGEDQLPHLEIARDLARSFNAKFGLTFPIPKKLSGKDIRVPSLGGEGKMSKSSGATIALTDSEEIIRQKCRNALTDPKRERRTDSGHPWECNLYVLQEHVLGADKAAQDIIPVCENAQIGCVECKDCFASAVISMLAPMQERRQVLARQKNLVRDVLHQGGITARESATETLEEVRTKVGLIRF